MKILLLGANGNLGKLTLNDLLEKNYIVTTLTKNPFEFKGTKNVTGSATDEKLLTKLFNENDVIISTLGAPSVEEFKKMGDVVMKVAGLTHKPLIWSGGAGSLTTKDGNRLVDLPESAFLGGPAEAFIPAIFGHYEVLKDLQKTNIDWVFVSPADTMDLNREEKPYELKAINKALYNKDDQSIIGYKTQARILSDLVENWKEFNKQQVTSVEK